MAYDVHEVREQTADEVESGGAPEPRLERLRFLAAVLPLAYVVAVVGFLAFNPFPSWASSLVAVAVTAPLVAAFAAVIFNVVDTTRADLLKREQRFANMIDGAPDGIVISRQDGVMVMVNSQTERIFGYAKDELIGQPVELLVPAALRGRHLENRGAYQRHPATRPMGIGLQLTALRKDGSQVPVEISLSTLEQDEGLLVNAVIRDISERRALEEERERLVGITETQNERERIAMDLHDGIIQSIYAVSLGLEAAMEDIEQEERAALRSRLDRSMNQLDEVTRDIRSYILHLRPARLDDALPVSLKLLADDFRVNSLIETSLEVDPAVPAIDPVRSMAAYHIAQEALNNVRKHGKATSVSVTLARSNGCVRLDVADNGVGFESGVSLPAEHQGLRNMAARARSAGTTLSIESELGAGTLVRLDIPLDAEA